MAVTMANRYAIFGRSEVEIMLLNADENIGRNNHQGLEEATSPSAKNPYEASHQI